MPTSSPSSYIGWMTRWTWKKDSCWILSVSVSARQLPSTSHSSHIATFSRIETRPTFLQVLLIDAFLFFYQLFTLYVAYLADPIPPGSADKLLLPSKPSRSRSKRKRTVSGRPEDAGLGLGLETSNEENVIDLGRDDEDEDLNVYDDEYERESLLHRGELLCN